eukprot:CAMPEP_0175041948 /NCGR_PEP_ID=MMETSP0052_2-20121109/2242_1 /TAXON_ID=51329 ORGANISM="Polytomella parva, Strain SAG 63-3" /NCGR_SAMPLE_ID=MMETSP0052_2 /ASSEMBLY_ACC=CAM_ASM_000194 /LENGTH=297 /DNA_ID=CAMNT_0016304607 /DNA_START=174 /DNA_END=1064 /DNA_ORIENTATION=-
MLKEFHSLGTLKDVILNDLSLDQAWKNELYDMLLRPDDPEAYRKLLTETLVGCVLKPDASFRNQSFAKLPTNVQHNPVVPENDDDKDTKAEIKEHCTKSDVNFFHPPLAPGTSLRQMGPLEEVVFGVIDELIRIRKMNERIQHQSALRNPRSFSPPRASHPENQSQSSLRGSTAVFSTYISDAGRHGFHQLSKPVMHGIVNHRKPFQIPFGSTATSSLPERNVLTYGFGVRWVSKASICRVNESSSQITPLGRLLSDTPWQILSLIATGKNGTTSCFLPGSFQSPSVLPSTSTSTST